jgi:hypothetical protein
MLNYVRYRFSYGSVTSYLTFYYNHIFIKEVFLVHIRYRVTNICIVRQKSNLFELLLCVYGRRDP